MKSKLLMSALLATSTLGWVGVAHAQEAQPAQPAQQAPDADADTKVAPDAPQSTEDLSSRAAFMEAQLEALQQQVNDLKAQLTKATPTWKGAPQWDDKDAGFTFKPKGVLQYDAGFVGTPGPTRVGTVGGLNYNNLGWNSRARRLILGAEGSLPGGFGYNIEFQLAQGTVDYEDVVLTYQRPGKPVKITIGNHYPLSSLETMTSSKFTSFLERAAFTDAFNYNRRLGISAAWLDPADRFTFAAGIWNQEINESTIFNRTAWQASVRATYSPTLAFGRLHLGANFQHRVFQRDSQSAQYRARPFTQITDQRFVDTGKIAAAGDDIIGLEFGAIMHSFHFAAEAQKVMVRSLNSTHVFPPNNGTNGGAFYNDNPSFESAYAEVGYFLTGETRGYKGGKWDRTKVLHPFDQGGWGAVQVNARVDYLNLRDRVSGTTIAAPDYVNGGKQIGYQLSVIWNPMDYVRFLAQYAHGSYTGGPRATTVNPTSSDPANERHFGVDTFAVRAQLEF
jgi:phosphate-selective porin OprO and OprP